MGRGFVRDRDNHANKRQTFEDGITVNGSSIFNGTVSFPTGVLSVSVYDTDVEVESNYQYAIDTSGGSDVTVTLPANPTVSDRIVLFDAKSTFDSYKLIIDPNGLDIQNDSSNVNVELAGARVELVYISAAYGWMIHVS